LRIIRSVTEFLEEPLYSWYDYNDEDIFKIFNKGVKRSTFVYARVSTAKQKPDLENEIEMLKQYCF
jgi:predicted site-specific integrase-resolvase